MDVKTWEAKHQADFASLHEAMHAITSMDLSGTAHTDWLTTVRAVREKVSSFSLFIPNSDKVLALLNTAEKVLLGVAALENLAKDA